MKKKHRLVALGHTSDLNDTREYTFLQWPVNRVMTKGGVYRSRSARAMLSADSGSPWRTDFGPFLQGAAWEGRVVLPETW
jgi:hypothetical protein